MGVLYVEHANVLELCYIELLSGDGSPYSILSVTSMHSSRMRIARLMPVSSSMHCSRMWTEFLTHASENITLPQLRCGR